MRDTLTSYRICWMTGKRSYSSRHAAKMACRGIGNRIRIYGDCKCGGWHVTAAVLRKRRDEDDWN